jgi:benzoyl-CoA reductase/2-hydroxyglutaryl-CoA dehydratase subunit BcrC/BadD/HgdB
MDNLIGIASNYVPEEIVELFGVPYRLLGNFNVEYELNLPTFTCSFIRDLINSFNSGGLDFLSGIIIPHSCDSLFSAYDLLERNNKFVYQFSSSIKNSKDGIYYFKRQLEELIHFLENYFRIKINKNSLIEIINLRDEVRKTLRNIGSLILKENKDIKYTEFLLLILKAMQSRSKDIKQFLENKYKRFKKYKEFKNISQRICLVGPILDNFKLIKAIESFDNTKIICDNLTNGWRYISGQVEVNDDPLEVISKYYLNKIHSPTFSDEKYTNHFKENFLKYNINKIIMFIQRGCEPHLFYVPILKDICKKHNISFISINIEHNEPNNEQILNQIQAFLEM